MAAVAAAWTTRSSSSKVHPSDSSFGVCSSDSSEVCFSNSSSCSSDSLSKLCSSLKSVFGVEYDMCVNDTDEKLEDEGDRDEERLCFANIK